MVQESAINEKLLMWSKNKILAFAMGPSDISFSVRALTSSLNSWRLRFAISSDEIDFLPRTPDDFVCVFILLVEVLEFLVEAATRCNFEPFSDSAVLVDKHEGNSTPVLDK